MTDRTTARRPRGALMALGILVAGGLAVGPVGASAKPGSSYSYHSGSYYPHSGASGTGYAAPRGQMGLTRPSYGTASGGSPASKSGGSDAATTSGASGKPTSAPTSSMGLTRPSYGATAPTPPDRASAAPASAMGLTRPAPGATTAGGPRGPGQPAAKGATSMGLSRPPASVAARAAPQGVGDRAASMAASKGALDRFRTAQASARAPQAAQAAATARSNPAYASYRGSWRSGDAYWTQRDRGMATYRAYDSNPTYYFAYHHSQPYYGAWDTMFLTALLVNASNEGYYDWAYAHRADPGYEQWLADQRTAAAGNAQMRQQLDDLQAHVAQLEAQHAKPQAADALPQGVEPASAIAPAVVAQDAMATSPADGANQGWGGDQASPPTRDQAPAQQGRTHGHVLRWVVLLVLVGAIVAFLVAMQRKGRREG